MWALAKNNDMIFSASADCTIKVYMCVSLRLLNPASPSGVSLFGWGSLINWKKKCTGSPMAIFLTSDSLYTHVYTLWCDLTVHCLYLDCVMSLASYV